MWASSSALGSSFVTPLFVEIIINTHAAIGNHSETSLVHCVHFLPMVLLCKMRPFPLWTWRWTL